MTEIKMIKPNLRLGKEVNHLTGKQGGQEGLSQDIVLRFLRQISILMKRMLWKLKNVIRTCTFLQTSSSHYFNGLKLFLLESQSPWITHVLFM